jgi:hypothetical protein
MSEQTLYRAVKASERLPTIGDLYHTNIRMVDSDLDVFPSKENFYSGKWEIQDGYEVVEWLEPLPPLTGIEERAKELFPRELIVLDSVSVPGYKKRGERDENEKARKLAIQLATEVAAPLRSRIDDLKIEIDWLKADKELLQAENKRLVEILEDYVTRCFKIKTFMEGHGELTTKQHDQENWQDFKTQNHIA